MAQLQFQTPRVPSAWSTSRETHPAVAMAIHAIAGNRRSPEQIWDAPTCAERDAVLRAVENYVWAGVFLPTKDDCYAWGRETVTLAVA